MIRRLALSFALSASLSPALRAETQADISADSIEDRPTGDVVFKGNARLADTGLLLTADQIRYNRQTQKATATGHVVLDRPGDRLLADVMTYDRNDGHFSASNLRVGRFPYYIEGPSAEGTRTEVVIHDAIVTYREPGVWQPTIRARAVTYSAGHFLRVSGANVGVGNYRPVHVMQIAENLTRTSSLWSVTVDGGYRHNLGAYADTGIHIPAGPGLTMGPDIGLYTFRGIMLGPIADYDMTIGQDAIKGFLRTGYIYDLGSRGTDILDNPVPSSRAFVEWRHNQQITPDLALNGSINWSSDSEVIRDFHAKQFVPVQEPDNYLEAVYSGDNYFGSVFTRFQPDSFYPVQQRLPEIRFDLLPTAIGGGFYARLDSSLVHLEEVPPDGGAFLRSTRFDTFMGISRPFTYKGIMDFTPVAGGRFTQYWDTTGAQDPGGASRSVGEVGFDADLKMSATFDYENPLWHIDGLRHLITPTLSYRYIPNGNENANWIPPIDRSTFTNYLPVLDLGDMRALDQMQAENVLRIGLNNTLQTRDKTYGSIDLVTFNLADDLHMQRGPGTPDFSNLFGEVVVTPAHWLEWRLEDTVAAKRFTQRAVDTSVTVREGEIWSASVGLGFLSDQYGTYFVPGLGNYPIVGLDIYHAEARVRLNEAYEAFIRGDFDARDHIFVDQFYGISQKVSNTWIVQYALVFSEGPNKEGGHFGLNVTLNMVRF